MKIVKKRKMRIWNDDKTVMQREKKREAMEGQERGKKTDQKVRRKD